MDILTKSFYTGISFSATAAFQFHMPLTKVKFRTGTSDVYGLKFSVSETLRPDPYTCRLLQTFGFFRLPL
jgi:hypothetical protein